MAGQRRSSVGGRARRGSVLPENPEQDITTSHYDGAKLEQLRGMHEMRKVLVRKIRRLTDRIRRQMKKNATINGSWYKLFKSYDKDGSGDITFDELCYVVYKELEVSKLEMSPKELRALWSVIDRDDDKKVTCQEFASFMRRAGRRRGTLFWRRMDLTRSPRDDL